MKASFQARNSDDLEMTLTLTAPLSEWKKLKEQLATQWPSWKIGSAITDMVIRADARLVEEVDAT